MHGQKYYLEIWNEGRTGEGISLAIQPLFHSLEDPALQCLQVIFIFNFLSYFVEKP